MLVKIPPKQQIKFKMANAPFYIPMFVIPKQTWWQKFLRIKPTGIIKFVSVEEYLTKK